MTTNQTDRATFPLGAQVVASPGQLTARVISAVEQTAEGVTAIRLGCVHVDRPADTDRGHPRGAVRLTTAELGTLIDALLQLRLASWLEQEPAS